MDAATSTIEDQKWETLLTELATFVKRLTPQELRQYITEGKRRQRKRNLIRFERQMRQIERGENENMVLER